MDLAQKRVDTRLQNIRIVSILMIYTSDQIFYDDEMNEEKVVVVSTCMKQMKNAFKILVL
jgi:hypothetical protein